MEDVPVCDGRGGVNMGVYIREGQEYHNARKKREIGRNADFCVSVSTIANVIRTAGRKLVARNFDGHL